MESKPYALNQTKIAKADDALTLALVALDKAKSARETMVMEELMRLNVEVLAYITAAVGLLCARENLPTP